MQERDVSHDSGLDRQIPGQGSTEGDWNGQGGLFEGRK